MRGELVELGKSDTVPGFYHTYPNFVDAFQIRHALRDEFITPKAKTSKIRHALRGELPVHGTAEELEKGHTLRDQSTSTGILYAPRRESWKPGRLHPNLSWTHYRTLLRVDKPQAMGSGIAFLTISTFETSQNIKMSRDYDPFTSTQLRKFETMPKCPKCNSQSRR